MKNIFLFLSLIVFSISAFAQDFTKSLTSARSAYSAGNLADARFAMDQMLASINQGIGQQILKILPAQIGSLNYNDKQDNISGASGSGLYINRAYGNYPNSAKIEITNNSPLITTLNASLSNPLMGAMMRNENQKVVKIQGYKSMLNKTPSSDGSKTSYELQVPMNNTLLTFKIDDSTEDQITSFANTIPLQKIAQLAQ
jgi:hypothetical protein